LLVTVNNKLILEIEIVHDLSCHPIRSMERGICPIAVIYFAINVLSFFNTYNRCWSTRVQILPQRFNCHRFGSHDVIGHVVGGFL